MFSRDAAKLSSDDLAKWVIPGISTAVESLIEIKRNRPQSAEIGSFNKRRAQP